MGLRRPPLAFVLVAWAASCGSRTAPPPFEAAGDEGGGGGPCTPTGGCVCCGEACVDLETDVQHCGGCFSACPVLANAQPSCDGGVCASTCAGGFEDCNHDPADGCEHLGPCVCRPGETQACYQGPPSTEGVGTCVAGVATCTADAIWGPCEGQVVPVAELCGNAADDDCDGVDPDVDQDGDGWSPCDADCCDTPAACAVSSHLVNPGAFEIPGNGVDDDCDAVTADAAPTSTCDGAPLDVPTSSLELVQAMDLCRFTSESPPLPQKTWGVIDSSLALADGNTMPPPADVQAGVLSSYGAAVAPKRGTTMAALSSGTARAEGDPGHVFPQVGPEPEQQGNFAAGTVAGIPSDYLVAHGGAIPKAPNCPACELSCTTAFDSIELSIHIRVPTNVNGFELDHRFFTAEFPEYICLDNDDHFLALLTSRSGSLPSDRNIAHDRLGNEVSANAALFDWCFPSNNTPPGACSAGTLDLVGTGMGGWNGAVDDGAATSWLTASAQVVPGETIDVRLVIWDGGDFNVDSLVLLDHFRWVPIR